MPGPQPELRAVFYEALERAAPRERAEYLERACQGRPELRARVEALLRAHQEASGFLEEPPGEEVTAAHEPACREGPGAIIGPYKLLEQIGEGGMGVVFLAEQLRPVRRRVALKVIRPGMDTRQVVARFEAERQALALMDHPNIARVLDADATESGRPYFVMELVGGVPITDFCDQNSLAPRERLGLFVDVCAAVQHAHTKGVIHRDLKPSNVLVTLHDGAAVVKVIDFGIAKATGQQLTDRTLLTNFAQMVGTPLYMSPEQAEMSGLDIDTRTDIYSLGVLLYELLTGTTPFDRERLSQAPFDEVRRIIREEEPPRPSKRVSSLGETLTAVSARGQTDPRRLGQLFKGELDWIVMKALEKDRNRRYETASGFAADVRRYLRDEPVSACPPSAWYRSRKFARRNKVALMTAGLVALALVAGTVASVWMAVRALQAEGLAHERWLQAEEDRELARRAERKAQEGLFQARLEQARASRWSGRVGQRFDSLKALTEAAQIARELGLDQTRLLELRNEAIAAMALADVRVWREWEEFPKQVHALAFDADLERYARANEHGEISVHLVADRRLLARLPAPGDKLNVGGIQFSPDGRYLGAVYGRGDRHAVRVWDWGRARADVAAPDAHAILPAFSPDSRQVALGFRDGTVRLCELPSGKESRRIAPVLPAAPFRVDGPAGMICFNPAGDKLAVCNGPSRGVHVYRAGTGGLLAALRHPQGWLEMLAWHPSGRTFATACGSRIFLWDAESTARPRAVLEVESTRVTRLAFSHQGDVLASNGYDSRLRFWSPWTGKQLASFPGVWNRVAPQFSRDDTRLPCLRGAHVAIFAVALGRECRRLEVNTTGACDFSPDRHLLAVTNRDGVGLWDPGSGSEVGRLPVPGTRSVLFDPAAGDLITSGPNGTLRWAVTTQGTRLHLGPPRPLPLPGVAVREALALSRDGGTLLARVDGDRAALVRGGQPTKPALLLGHPQVWSVAVSPEGKWAATGPWNGAGVRVWDAATGRGEDLPDSRGIKSATAAFSPDGRWLVIGSNREYRFWRVGTWRPGLRLACAGGDLPGRLAFSPDGGLVALRHSGSVVKLRAPGSGAELATLDMPGVHLLGWLAFGARGSQLAVLDELGACYLWDLRRVREGLAAMGLDWDLPPYPPAPPAASGNPPQVQADLGAVGAALARPHLAQARAHANARRWDRAVAEYSRALELSPGDVAARGGRGDALREQGKLDDAVADHREVVRLKPDSADAHNNLGYTFQLKGAWDDAIAEHRHATRLNPADGRGNHNLGHCLLEMGKLDEAIPSILRAICFGQGHPSSYFILGRALRGKGRWDGAIASFQEATRLAPVNAKYHSTLAWLLANCPDPRFRDPGEAVRQAKRAVELAPKAGGYWMALGMAHYRAGDWEAAAAALEKSAQLRKGGNAFDWFFLAMARWRLGQKEEARKWYARAVGWMEKNQPDNEELGRFRAEAAALLKADPEGEEKR
jgi:serine/threonine protein kinase/tetratricopeptide (TPR) repeat protein/WD40 repeat protein